MEIFFEIHSGNLREGPGSFESTKKAFLQLKNLPVKPKILDLGCGPGQQSIDLANLSNGIITSVDNHQPFLESLKLRIKDLELEEQIDVLNADMSELNFKPSSFNIVWSEGAIYIVGFEKGLRYWKNFLKSNGYLAVSHISWLKDNPPGKLFDFWKSEYPEITTIEENLNIIDKSGLKIVSHFTLPSSDWLINYYKPLENKLAELKIKHRNNQEAIEIIDAEIIEIKFYKKYSDYYGYEFFITQKQ